MRKPYRRIIHSLRIAPESPFSKKLFAYSIRLNRCSPCKSVAYPNRPAKHPNRFTSRPPSPSPAPESTAPLSMRPRPLVSCRCFRRYRRSLRIGGERELLAAAIQKFGRGTDGKGQQDRQHRSPQIPTASPPPPPAPYTSNPPRRPRQPRMRQLPPLNNRLPPPCVLREDRKNENILASSGAIWRIPTQWSGEHYEHDTTVRNPHRHAQNDRTEHAAGEKGN